MAAHGGVTDHGGWLSISPPPAVQIPVSPDSLLRDDLGNIPAFLVNLGDWNINWNIHKLAS